METARTADAWEIPPQGTRSGRIAAAALLVCACLMLPGSLILLPSWNVHWFGTGSVVLLAAGVLLCFPDRLVCAVRSLPLRLLIPGLILTLTGFWHISRHLSSYGPDDMGLCLLYTAVPLFGLTFRRELLRIIPPFMSVVWLVNIVNSAGAALQGRFIVGFTSNINWNASLTFFSGALALYWIFTGPLRRAAWRFAAASFIVAGSLWLFVLTSCRALLLGVCFSIFVFLCKRVPEGKARRVFRLTVLLLILAAAAGAFFALRNPSVIRRLHSSDRTYFYLTVPRMILKASLFGYGAPSFEQEYLPYKTADYYRLEHCAVRTNHPHNDLLFVGAGFGLVGLLCWILILCGSLIPFYRRSKGSLRDLPDLLFFLFLILLIHAQLDLVFFHIPLCFFAVLIPGILAEPAEENASVSPCGTCTRLSLRLCGIVFCAVSLFAAGVNAAETEILYRARLDPSPEKTQRAFDLLMKLPRMTARPLYQLFFVDAEWTVRNPDKVLAAAAAIRKTAIPDYAHLNLIEAQALTAQERYAEAERLFLRECSLYPLQVIPLFMLRDMYARAGNAEGVQLVNARLLEIIQERGFDEEDVRYILRHPDYDLHPWTLREDRLRAGWSPPAENLK